MRNKNNHTIEFYLGVSIGSYIASVIMPTLSTDMLRNHNIIQVDEQDTDTHDILEKKWRDGYKNGEYDKSSWNNYKEFNSYLVKKYFPQILECGVEKFGVELLDTPEKMFQFKEGLIHSLWNSDICSYHLEHDKIKIIKGVEYAWCDEIHLELDTKEK